MQLGKLNIKKKLGSEVFHINGDSLQFDLLSFWQWYSSDILDNTLRGIIAEYIVSQDVVCVDEISGGWAPYDLLSPQGIKIEVKSGAYVQSWEQKNFSTISFNIGPKRGWDAETNILSKIIKRHSDIYVFCVLAHKDKTTIDPLNLAQWEFYILPTDVLNKKLGDQKTIKLSSLLKLNPKKVKYGEIRSAIQAELQA